MRLITEGKIYTRYVLRASPSERHTGTHYGGLFCSVGHISRRVDPSIIARRWSSGYGRPRSIDARFSLENVPTCFEPGAPFFDAIARFFTRRSTGFLIAFALRRVVEYLSADASLSLRSTNWDVIWLDPNARLFFFYDAREKGQTYDTFALLYTIAFLLA